MEGLDVRVLRLPFVYGDGDPHIAEAVPMMRSFPPRQRMSIAHHADVAQAVAPEREGSPSDYDPPPARGAFGDRSRFGAPDGVTILVLSETLARVW